MKNRFLWLALFLVLPAIARADFEIPADHDVLFRTGSPSAVIGDRLRVLQWNIHKATAGARWLRDFQLLSAQSDVVLVQEVHRVPILREAEKLIAGFEWFFTTSFFLKGEPTGLLSASRWPSQGERWYRSQDREPILQTPKMAMSMNFSLADGRELLVVNIHCLNFTPISSFERQLMPLINVIKMHVGPVLFGGDFNTWNPGRLKFLLSQLKNLGLSEVALANDTRRLKLDHMFVRGLGVISAKVRSDIVTSDHAPLLAILSFLPPNRGLRRSTP